MACKFLFFLLPVKRDLLSEFLNDNDNDVRITGVSYIVMKSTRDKPYSKPKPSSSSRCKHSLEVTKLQAELDDLKQKYRNVKEKLQTAVSEKQEVLEQKDKMLECVICCVEKKEVSLVPCGHTFCSNCVLRMMDREQCAFCRTEILMVAKTLLTD